MITIDEMLVTLQKRHGVRLTKETLKSWQQHRGFPKPEVIYLGRGKGRVGLYPDRYIVLIKSIIRRREEGHGVSDAIKISLEKQSISHLQFFPSFLKGIMRLLKLRIVCECHDSLADETYQLLMNGCEKHLSHIRLNIEVLRELEQKYGYNTIIANSYRDSKYQPFTEELWSWMRKSIEMIVKIICHDGNDSEYANRLREETEAFLKENNSLANEEKLYSYIKIVEELCEETKRKEK